MMRRKASFPRIFYILLALFTSVVLLFLFFTPLSSKTSTPSTPGERKNKDSRVILPAFHGKFPVMNYFCKAQNDHREEPLTICTQLTINRLPRLEKIAETWGGPISATLYSINPEEDMALIKEFCESSTALQSWVNIHVVPAWKGAYPINALRNIARESVVTKYLFMLDVDFIPNPDLKQYVQSLIPLFERTPSTVWIIPAFETTSLENDDLTDDYYPTTKEEMVRLMGEGEVKQIHIKDGEESHRACRYEKWKTAKRPYRTNYEMNFEPYFIGTTATLPSYDERFEGWGIDKVSFVYEVFRAGWTFMVLPNAWIVHISHAQIKDAELWNRKEEHTKNLKIWDVFPGDMTKKYGPEPEQMPLSDDDEITDDNSEENVHTTDDYKSKNLGSFKNFYSSIFETKPTYDLSNFTQVLERYSEIHRRIMDPLDKTVPKKYVVVDDDPETGLGNRYQVLVGAFLFAILTDRALLVDWPEVQPFLHWNKEELVAMPPLSELLEPPGFDWDFSHFVNKVPQLQCGRVEKWVDMNSYNWARCCKRVPKEANAWKWKETEECEEHLQYRGHEEEFQCLPYDEAFPQTVVHLVGWDYFVYNMLINPFHGNLVKEWFEDYNIYTPIANYLFRPIKSITGEIEKFKKTNFYGKKVLGLQIRKVGINKLADEQEAIFWDCAEEMIKEEGWKQEEVVFFIASDTFGTKERAKKKYGNQIVYYTTEVSRADKKGIIEGLVDMLLLSQCDQLIVSAASTYGAVAYGLSGRTPKSVNKLGECVRRKTWQPCFFEFTKRSCYEFSLVNEENLIYTKECKS